MTSLRGRGVAGRGRATPRPGGAQPGAASAPPMYPSDPGVAGKQSSAPAGSYAPTFISINSPIGAEPIGDGDTSSSSSEDEVTDDSKKEAKNMMNMYGESMPALLRAGMIDPSIPGGARQMRQLEMKQKVMEASMRRLLRSMRDLRLRENDQGYNAELDKRRRLKLTRMIQILMLQRRNLQLQSDTLRKEVGTLTKKFLALRKRAERLVVENINMRKFYTESRGDIDRKTIQIENLLQNKTLLQKQIQDRAELQVEVENLKFEVKRLIVENHNLKETLSNNESLLKSKTQDREELELENTALRTRLTQMDAEGTNLRLRNEKLLFENEEFKKETMMNKNNKSEFQSLTYEYEKVREKLNEKERDYHRLEAMYEKENESRRYLQNLLQEERGNIRVLCRVRPPDGKEPDLFDVSFDRIKVPEKALKNWQSQSSPCFTFNKVFNSKMRQSAVFEEIKPLILSCVDGYNVCVMAYGPTGCGKTYSMQGVKEDPGITIRAVHHLFDICNTMKGVWQFKTSVSMFEIHNETIYDLLDKGVQIVRISDDGVEVRLHEAHEKEAANEQDLLFWIAKGHKRRKVAATHMNLHSSRSHLVIRIDLRMHNLIDDGNRSSCLIFCDLAGSESAESIQATGDLKIETGYINRSLIALGRVFDALRAGANIVPYRDSKLTHLLKPCLGGHAKCVLLIAVSGQPDRVYKSAKALQFGQNAMRISLGKTKQNIKILTRASKPKRMTFQCKTDTVPIGH